MFLPYFISNSVKYSYKSVDEELQRLAKRWIPNWSVIINIWFTVKSSWCLCGIVSSTTLQQKLFVLLCPKKFSPSKSYQILTSSASSFSFAFWFISFFCLFRSSCCCLRSARWARRWFNLISRLEYQSRMHVE